MAGENLPNPFDKLRFGHGELRLGLLLQIFLAVLDGGERGAEDQILDLHLAFRLLVAALDDDARRAAPIGIFHLRLHAGLAEIKLGADVRCAKRLRHLLIVGDAVAIEHEHDDGALRGARLEFAEALEAEQEPRHADGDAGGRNLLAGEALDQPVIAPAADDRAEPDGLTLLVLDRSGQLGLEHWSCVIFQPAHDRGIDFESISHIQPPAMSGCRALELAAPWIANCSIRNCSSLPGGELRSSSTRRSASAVLMRTCVRSAPHEAQHPLCKSPTFVLAAFA